MTEKVQIRPEAEKFSITRGDAVAWLKTLPSESIDLVLTDPAYESLEKHRAKGTTTRLKISKSSSNRWFDIFPNARLQDLMNQLYRVAKRNAHVYIFCDQETSFILKPMGEKSGFKFWKPVIWDKVSIGMGYHYRSRYEMILFFEKGKKKLSCLGTPDILSFPRVRNGYPTEKPVALAQLLIGQSSVKDDVICDPFCGSGSFAEAAMASGRRFLGCDTSPDAIALTRSRARAQLKPAQEN